MRQLLTLATLLWIPVSAGAQQQLVSAGSIPIPGTSDAPGYSQVEFSPDGKHLIIYGQQRLWAVNIANGKGGPVEASTVNQTDIEFAPNSKAVGILLSDRSYEILDLTKGALKNHWSILWDATKFRFSPDGKTVVGAYQPSGNFPNGYVRTWDAATGNELQTYSDVDMPPVDARITPDGEHVVAVCGQEPVTNPTTGVKELTGEVDIWDLKTGALQDQTPVFDGSEFAALTDDCKHAAFVKKADDSAPSPVIVTTDLTSYILTFVDISTDGITKCSIKPKIPFQGKTETLTVSSSGKTYACGVLFQPDGSLLYPIVNPNVSVDATVPPGNSDISADGKWLACVRHASILDDDGDPMPSDCVFVWKLP